MLNRGFCRIGFIGESLNFEGESVFFLAIYVGGLFFCWGVFSCWNGLDLSGDLETSFL